jgi:hypothetical protein
MNKLCLALLFCSAASAGQAQDPAWTGSARCDVTITGSGYTDRQIHTWQMTGGAPTKRGAFNIYAGTWSVSGGGSLDRTTGDQSLHAQWTRSVQSMSGPISVVARASDGMVLIQADHAQLRGRGAVSGTQEVRRGGRVISTTPISAEAFEHAFPSIKGNSTSKQMAGQTSDAPKGSFGLMVSTPPVPPTTLTCETQLAESRTGSEQVQAQLEAKYNRLLAENASERAALMAERAADQAAAAVRTTCAGG